MFLRAVSKDSILPALSCKRFPKLDGMICERFNGKSLYVRLLVSLIQNCSVPSEQFFGSI